MLVKLQDDGGYRREGQTSAYRRHGECSFDDTVPDGGDTAQVDMTNIFANNMAFKPLMQIKVLFKY